MKTLHLDILNELIKKYGVAEILEVAKDSLGVPSIGYHSTAMARQMTAGQHVKAHAREHLHAVLDAAATIAKYEQL